MMKLFTPLLLALTTLTGCELYFGGDGHNGDDRWTYCAADGYYVCDGDNCEWAGARCPDDPNYTCGSDTDCAAGCYCSTAGVCEEAGFCGSETDCPDGFHCDIARSSCVPDTCVTSDDCKPGEYCEANGGCTASCVCSTDAEAQAQGFGFCDEVRSTCEPTPAGGSCGGASSCQAAEPICAAGEVPLIKDNCYTGACSTIATCDVTPTCAALQHESDCLGRNAECSSVYYGLNCTKPDGSACMAGDQGCTCTDFAFAECRPRASNMMVFEGPNGQLVDVFSN